MALTYRELTGVGQAASGDYRGGLGKSCCSSCARGGPCTGCGGPAGKSCHCKGGALGATTTVSGGQEDLEAPPYGYQYAQTTKKNTTVFGRPVGKVPPTRRVSATRLVEELEFLAGTPGVHPRVLAQKAWQARKALMESSDWQYANYQSPFASYDSSSDLKARLAAVERVLGIDKVSPKVAAALYGMGGMSGLGIYAGPAWGQMYNPVDKLASCIRGALCAPTSYCCPPGTYFDDPYEDEYYDEEFYDEPYDEYLGPPPSGGNGGNGGNGTWTGGDPNYMTMLDQIEQPKQDFRYGNDYQLVDEPKTALVSQTPWISPQVTTGPTGVVTSPDPIQVQTQTQTGVVTSPTPTPVIQMETAPVKSVVTSPAPAPTQTQTQWSLGPATPSKTAVSTASVPLTSPTISTSPTPSAGPVGMVQVQQARQYTTPKATGGLVVGSGAALPGGGGGGVMMAGLGARRPTGATRAMVRLRAQLRAARLRAARGRRR
jgi:hypothetical protein